jgi:putative methyltransferase (TIGR04325 family)
MNPRNAVKNLLPPIVLEVWKDIQNSRKRDFDLTGDYPSWNEAVAASTGYDSKRILEKTKAALLKVKNGEATYERDSVLFDEIQYTWPLLAGLMWVAAQSKGRLNVLDFGGSLGSTYYQNRAFLRDLPEVQWNIIEQPAHVNVGKEYFEDDVLKFFPNIETCLSETKPNVILLSSVLQYLESPYKILNKLLDLPCDYVIIDRTPFWDGSTDRLCVQQVPPSIYTASYPVWIFSEQIFLQYIQQRNFEIISEFQSLDMLKAPVHAIWKGMLLERENFSTGTILRT